MQFSQRANVGRPFMPTSENVGHKYPTYDRIIHLNHATSVGRPFIAIHRKPHTVLRRLAVQPRTVFGDAPCLKLSVDGYMPTSKASGTSPDLPNSHQKNRPGGRLSVSGPIRKRFLPAPLAAAPRAARCCRFPDILFRCGNRRRSGRSRPARGCRAPRWCSHPNRRQRLAR